MIEPPSFIRRKTLFERKKEESLYVGVEVKVEKLLVPLSQKGANFARPAFAKKMMSICPIVFFFLRCRNKRSKVGKLGYIALYRRYVLPNLGSCSI